jgi:two-component system, NtrC family, sensor kinase
VVLEPVALRHPLLGARAAAEPHFAGRGALLAALDGVAPDLYVLGDAVSLEQLFLNLLLNAADTLTPGRSAGVRVETGPGVVRVTVWDEGEGMSPRVRERVLEPFFSTKPEGTGLGLPIANRIALAHGAGLDIDSAPGRGTRVLVTLRRAPAARRGVSDRNDSQRAGRSDTGRTALPDDRTLSAKR